jgi:hypothetical protein
MRTRTGFLAVIGANDSSRHTRRHHLPERTYRQRHLDDSNRLSANGTQVDVADSVPSNIPAVGLAKG